MNKLSNPHRRTVLKSLMFGTFVASGVMEVSEAADAPLVSEADPTASALHYVADVKASKDAKPGSKCANCALYTGDRKAAQGPCSIFAGKQVKSNGWCSAWTAVKQ